MRSPVTKRRGRNLKASELVALEIVQNIVEDGLSPGDSLPMESALSVQYGVSRPTLREAMRLLEFQGLISVRPGPGAGTVVGKAEPESLARTLVLYLHLLGVTYAEIMQTWRDTECLVGQAAAANPDRARVRELMLPFARPLEELSQDEHSQRVGAVFHNHLRDLTGNEMLNLLAWTVSQVATDHVMSSVPTMIPEHMVHDHSQIAQAVIDGDVERSGRLMREHIDHIVVHYREHWPNRVGERPDWNLFK